MKRKGIFITFAMFFLIMAVMALNTVMQRTAETQQVIMTESSAFANVNNRFYNIYSETFILKEGYAGRVQGRILPFLDFKSGGNWVEFKETIPKITQDFDDTYDALNLFEVFIEEESISQDLNIDLNAIKNEAWGGEQGGLGYLILPQCVLYVQDTDYVMEIIDGSAVESCPEPFVFSSGGKTTIDKIEVTMLIGRIDLLVIGNPIECASAPSNYFGAGGGLCKTDEYPSGGGRTDMAWGEVHFICDPTDPLCLTRFGSTGEVGIASAFYKDDRSANKVTSKYEGGNNIDVYFTSSGAASTLIFKIDNTKSPVIIGVTVKITFREDITTKFNAFNYIVITKPNFEIERSFGTGSS